MLVTANMKRCMDFAGIVQWIISTCENEIMRDCCRIILRLLRDQGMPYHLFCGIGPQPKCHRILPSPQHSQFRHQQPVHLPHACFDAIPLCIVCENAIVSPYKPFRDILHVYPMLPCLDCFRCIVDAAIPSCLPHEYKSK